MTVLQQTEQQVHDGIDLTTMTAMSAMKSWHNALLMTANLNFYMADQGLRAAAQILNNGQQLLQTSVASSFILTQNGIQVWQNYTQAMSNQMLVNMQTYKGESPQLAPDVSFYFRGPQNTLNVQIDNLERFVEAAQNVDDTTWLYHLKRGDYSHWFRTTIQDDELAAETTLIEQADLPPTISREQVLAAIKRRYVVTV